MQAKRPKVECMVQVALTFLLSRIFIDKKYSSVLVHYYLYYRNGVNQNHITMMQT